ncbi:MAG: N-acetylglucosamine-6-phosphate deacetylase [Ruminococcaceae bacterium]|nr:N-acetylglucosamine-6-phosphate deacetylase [Oscillospiraceae bacterium]
MKTLLRGARVWMRDRKFAEDCSVLIEDDRILAVGKACDGHGADRVIELSGGTLIPGLVDVHTHGRCGFDFCDADGDALLRMKEDYARHGVTSVMATLASDTREGWLSSIARIEESGFAGIHFEGRYLNPSKRGAHAAHLLSPLDPEELSGLLSHVTLPRHISLAPELDPEGAFIARAVELGATVGIAHTAATAEEARAALRAGARSFTHLFNAMPPLHHREGGAVSVALCGDGFAELIVDGVHICPDMVRLAWRCLGAERTVLITDSMAGTGCPDGEYSIAGLPVTVKDGRALTHEGAIAGSTLNLFEGMKNLMRFADVSLEDAVACATLNPARMVGIDAVCGSIEEGTYADLLLLDENEELSRVIWRGKDVGGVK